MELEIMSLQLHGIRNNELTTKRNKKCQNKDGIISDVSSLVIFLHAKLNQMFLDYRNLS